MNKNTHTHTHTHTRKPKYTYTQTNPNMHTNAYTHDKTHHTMLFASVPPDVNTMSDGDASGPSMDATWARDSSITWWMTSLMMSWTAGSTDCR